MSAAQPVILGEVPSLSKLYVNAAAQAARRRILGTHGTSTLPETGHEVRGVRADVANLTAYQHLIGLTARDTLPAGYLHALAFPLAMSVMNRDDFPLPLLGMVHLSNYIEQRSPVIFTDLLDISARVENLRGHRAGTQLDVIAEIRSAGRPDIRWTGRSTYLAKGVFLPGIDVPSPQNGRPDFAPPHPTAVWDLGVETGRAYAAVSGDFNPIHLSALSAKALGMRRSIAHGMYLASRALADVGPVKGESFGWDVTFDAPVYLPGRVALEITTGQAPGGGWERSGYVAWNPRSGRKHFRGSVAPL
ncbi:MaoC family dehydratase [Pseudarthrobacter sp. IC2-21]|uniref:MaoC family dehydratase n=1 Tax=Pseudarthrobacter sp. IC2-21 TaxID=3092262 RepID=UPI002A6A7ED1|nr:MaoC/PaaZ C-terminal domain-containing protein [Pseudarthrobacter sp. IC2-21]